MVVLVLRDSTIVVCCFSRHDDRLRSEKITLLRRELVLTGKHQTEFSDQLQLREGSEKKNSRLCRLSLELGKK